MKNLMRIAVGADITTSSLAVLHNPKNVYRDVLAFFGIRINVKRSIYQHPPESYCQASRLIRQNLEDSLLFSYRLKEHA